MPRPRVILAYSPLAAFLLVVALWVRSFAYQDQIRRYGNWVVRSSQGVISARLMHEPYEFPEWYSPWSWEPYLIRNNSSEASQQWLAFHFSTQRRNLLMRNDAWLRGSIPHWFLALAAGLLFVWARPAPKFRFSMCEFALVVTGFTLLLGFAS